MSKLTKNKSQLVDEIKDAVVEMKLIKSGKKSAIDAETFIKKLKA